MKNDGLKIVISIILGLAILWAGWQVIILAAALVKLIIPLAVLGGAGYLIYKVNTGQKGLAGRDRMRLP